MKIIFFGTPEFVIPVIEKLRDQHTVIALVTTPDQKVGRKQLVTPSPVSTYGETHAIPVFKPEKLTTAVLESLKELVPDLIVVASYGLIIPQSFIDLPRFGAINIHPSLLPKFRGASPIQATLLSGDAVGGVTVIQMDQELDHGPIIAQETYSIQPTDTTESLLPVLFTRGVEIFLDSLEAYTTKTLIPTIQDDSQATFCTRFTKEDGYITIEQLPDAATIDRMIRAFTPWPGVWTKLHIRGQELRVKLLPKQMLQVEGKNKVTVKEFLNGYPELREIVSKLFVTTN